MTRLMQQRKELMKNGIYEAAVEVLVEHGFEAMTMDRVAEAAGVAKGSVYNYFPNKLELLRFVHDKTVEPIHARIDAILVEKRPAVDKLKTVLRTWFGEISRQRMLFQLLFSEYAVKVLLKEDSDTSQHRAIRDLTSILQQGIDEGVFRRVDVPRAATMMFGAVHELCDRQLVSGDSFSVDEAVEVVADFYLHGIGKNDG